MTGRNGNTVTCIVTSNISMCRFRPGASMRNPRIIPAIAPVMRKMAIPAPFPKSAHLKNQPPFAHFFKKASA